MDAARTLRERFQGALLGLAVGDALAAHTQFRKPGSFAAVGDLLGGGPFDLPRGAWTDDTAMALLLAESLLECEGFDAQDQVNRYVRWQREGYGSATGQCVGISANVARALATAQYKHQPFAGSHDPAQLDKDPLSRVAPVVMYFFADTAAAVARAARGGTCHRPGAHRARLRAAAGGHGAPGAGGAGQDRSLQPPRETWMSASTRAGSARRVRRVVLPRACRRTSPAADISCRRSRPRCGPFTAARRFAEGALLAANLGRDSDVVAAVYGQLAGAYHGVSAIPGIWRNSLMKQEVVIDTADRLLTHALVTLGD